MSARFAESVVEDAAAAWLEALGWKVRHDPEIAAGEPGAERNAPNYREGEPRESRARAVSRRDSKEDQG